MSFSVGSLVRVRRREWVVLPGSAGPVLMVRPLGGGKLEETAIHRGLETIEPARFAPPDPTLHGDHHSASLLREALRLGFRSSVGPFRSFAHLAVDPRPYQLVPLLMALKPNPVRMFIADDVGIGKTIEAALVARELLDRDDARCLAVLCPPHLAEQWQSELADKFDPDCDLVLPGTTSASGGGRPWRCCDRSRQAPPQQPRRCATTTPPRRPPRRTRLTSWAAGS